MSEAHDTYHVLGRDLDFDPDQLREKYRHERDKRINPLGDKQFQETIGEFAHFSDEDPFANSDGEREPITRNAEFLIVGAGFAGMMMAGRLKEAGYNDIVILDWGSDFGGTWYWNRYPGAQCDIEAYCYLPLLEETNFMPKGKYAYQPEIYEHSRRIADHYGLREHALFSTRVTGMRWHEDRKVWQVSTSCNDELTARYVVTCTGPMSRPKLPGVPGIENFKGHSFHTSRWDYDYTGGDHKGNLTGLKDKRVGIIGTGATAIQCVPFLGESAKHLYVFQRTPSSVGPRGYLPTDPEWVKTLGPGWQRARQKNLDDVVGGRPFEEDLVKDGWTDIFRNLQSSVLPGMGKDPEEGVSPEEAALAAEIADFEKMNDIRARIASTVEDEATAELLKPWYQMFCKRPCFNDEYLPTFNRDNVTLVDTSDFGGVERITENGVVVDGVEYEVDCLIYSTGFEVSSGHKRRIGFEIEGKNGQSVYDHWAEGRRTLHGHSTHGFPNWFVVGSSQNGISFNYAIMLEMQTEHLVAIFEEARRRDATVIEASAEAEDAWVKEIRRLAADNAEFFESCTPGFYNNEGQARDTTATFTGDAYAGGANAFHEVLIDWRENQHMDGIDFSS